MRFIRSLLPLAAIALALGTGTPSVAQGKTAVLLAQAVSAQEANKRGDDAYDRKDYAEAMRWYREAAAQGYALGQANIGYLYSKGLGVPPNDKEAVFWYRLAAGQGQREAQYNLGLRYEGGRGVPKDIGQARYWIQKSAAAGDADAQKWLQTH